jgi:hypothetical protein
VANVRVKTVVAVLLAVALTPPAAGRAAPAPTGSVTSGGVASATVVPASQARSSGTPTAESIRTAGRRRAAAVSAVSAAPSDPPNDNALTGGDPSDNLPSLPITGPNVIGLLMLAVLLLLGGVAARIVARKRSERGWRGAV